MVANQPRESILVGIDDSEGTRAALAWAAAAATTHQWSLTLAHAHVDVTKPPLRGFTPAEADVRAEAHALLKRAAAHVGASGEAASAADLITRPGRPDRLLIDLAENSRMVVVGRQGRGGFRDMLLGSTAYRVAEQCSVPVVIVPEGWDMHSAAEGPVVLGLDEDSGEDAIAFAFDYASRTGARLEAVHIFAPPMYLAAGGFGGYVPTAQDWPWNSEEAIEERRRTLSEQLAGWREKYPEVDLHPCVRLGYPASVLIEESSTARLLVVGGRDHGVVASVLIGSVARNLMHHATCPLAVVHTAR
jgi:nucleotide-binding universal stress UspA family protein